MRVKPSSENPKYVEPYKLKPTVFPDGFVLVQDTREQHGLFYRPPKGLVICSGTLHDGDYSIRGFENVFAVERKGITDLLPYCSTDHDKTKAKMERFRKMEFVGLVIEHKESEILKHQLFSRVHPEVVRAALTSFEVRYGVHIYYGDRADCARWLLDRAVKFYNVKKEL